MSTYRTQRRGGKGITAMATKEEDYVETVFTASTHDFILFFTNKGRVHRKKGYQIPESGRTAKGTNLVNVLPVEQGEKVTAMIHLREFPEDRYLIMVTRNGTVKRHPALLHQHRPQGGHPLHHPGRGGRADLRPGDRRRPGHPHRHPRRHGHLLQGDGRALHGP